MRTNRVAIVRDQKPAISALPGTSRLLLATPSGAGAMGNSHMMMLDKNNLEVADVIIDWIDRHVRR